MKFIEIYATRRSGHHAFISWLIANITGKTHNFNLHLNPVEEFENLVHINDALFNKRVVGEYLTNNKNKIPLFILNYEENDIIESIANDTKTIKVVFVRDFLNVMASKIASPNMKGIYKGLKDETIIKENIFNWKKLAKHYLESDLLKIKYEDFITNGDIRGEFLFNLLKLKDEYNPLNLKGTNSSFVNQYDPSKLNSRYKNVKFPDIFKDIVKHDSELNELIYKMGYTPTNYI